MSSPPSPKRVEKTPLSLFQVQACEGQVAGPVLAQAWGQNHKCWPQEILASCLFATSSLLYGVCVTPALLPQHALGAPAAAWPGSGGSGGRSSGLNPGQGQVGARARARARMCSMPWPGARPRAMMESKCQWGGGRESTGRSGEGEGLGEAWGTLCGGGDMRQEQ